MVLTHKVIASRSNHIRLACACILGLTAVSGCGKSGPKYPTGEVSGTVKYKGEPISQGQITFFSTGAEGYFATGSIRDGKYIVPDAPTGKCKISIQIQTNENVGAIPPQQMRMVRGQIEKAKAQGLAVPDESTLQRTKKSIAPKIRAQEMDVQKGKQTKDWDLQ